ncbi:MAG: UDP-N-acetylglucosamine--N-acetylmuramyl-(pentapeptide) pyrophosphoryl-undecaprenol N-acetylglucosamine transferase [Holosporales bacterium]
MITLITGGTGGHVFPAVALYEELKSRHIAAEIIVDQRGKRFLPSTVACYEIQIHRTFPPLGRFFYPLSLVGAFLQSLWRFVVHRPKAVVGFGGYTTVPALCAAKLLNIPVVIHEGNAFIGKANRLMSRFATAVAVSFPGTVSHHPKTVITGFPLRSAFFESFPYMPRTKDDPFHILVVGGSQGASLFAKLIPDAISMLELEEQKMIVVHHQCKKEQLDITRQEYKSLSCRVILKPFFDDMPHQYRNAHVVITRAGASSIFELAATKCPCILYPFMASVEGDQAKNAQIIEKMKGGWVYNEKESGAHHLANVLKTLIHEPHLLEERSANIAKLVMENPTKALADLVLSIAKRNKL